MKLFNQNNISWEIILQTYDVILVNTTWDRISSIFLVVFFSYTTNKRLDIWSQVLKTDKMRISWITLSLKYETPFSFSYSLINYLSI